MLFLGLAISASSIKLSDRPALMTNQLCRQGAKKYVVGAYALVLRAFGERKRTAAVELQVGVSCLEDSAYPDCIASMEEKTLRPGQLHEHGRDARRNALASLVDDVSPDGYCQCREYLIFPVGHDGLRLF